MSAYAQPAQTTATPSVAPPITSSAKPASGSGSNAARQEDLGLMGDVLVAAADLAGLGPMLTVVLDALPLDDAFEMAWPIRHDAAVRAWLAALDAYDLFHEAPQAMECILDHVWKAGTGVELEGEGDLALAFGKVGAGASVRVVRVKEGFEVEVCGSPALAAVWGVGEAMTGAGGVSVWGASAELSLADTHRFTAEWLLSRNVIAESMADAVWQGFVTGLGPAALVAEIAKLLTTMKANSWEISQDFSAGAKATAGLMDGAAASASTGVGFSVGAVEERAFIEIHLHGGVRCPHRSALLDRLGIDGEFEVEASVRVSGDWQAFLVGEQADVEFSVAIEALDQIDTLESKDPATLTRFLVGHATDAVAGAFSGKAKEMRVPADITLVREVERRVSLDGVASVLGIRLDAFDEHVPDVATLEKDALLSGSVRVPQVAVAAAIGGGIRWSDARTPEDMTVGIASAIAANFVGGCAPDVSAFPKLNWAAARAAVEIEEGKIEMRYRLTAGMGVGIAAGMKVEAELGASATGIVECDLPMRLVMDQRRKLFLCDALG